MAAGEAANPTFALVAHQLGGGRRGELVQHGRQRPGGLGNAGHVTPIVPLLGLASKGW